MAEELISRYVDTDAISEQTKFLLAEIGKVDTAFKKLNSSKGSVSSANSGKETTAALKKANDELIKNEKLSQQAARTATLEAKAREAAAKATIAQANAEKKLNAEKGAKSGGGSIPFTTNLAELEAERKAISLNKNAVNELQKAELKEQLAASAWAASQKKVTEEIKKTATSTAEQAKLLRANQIYELKEKMLLDERAKALKNQAKEEYAAKGSLEQRRAALVRLNAAYDKLSPAERDTSWGQRLKTTVASVSTQVKTLEMETGRAGRNVGNYEKSVSNVFQKAWSGLRNLAYLIPGLGIGGLIGLIVEPLADLVTKLTTFNSRFKQQAEVLAAAKDGFIEVATSVESLKNKIKSAKGGFGDKDAVLKEYNETLGKSTGHAKSLDEAENLLVKNAPNFIRATYLKAAAQVAAGKAAEAAFEAADIRRKKESEFLTFADRAVSTPIPEPGKKTPDQSAFQIKYAEEQGKKRREAAAKLKDADVAYYEKLGLDLQEAADKAFNKIPGGDVEGRGEQERLEKVKIIRKKFFEDELKTQIEALKKASEIESLFLVQRENARKDAAAIETKLLSGTTRDQLQEAKDRLDEVLNFEKSSKIDRLNALNEYNAKKSEIEQKSAFEERQIQENLNSDLLRIRQSYLVQQKKLEDEADAQFRSENDSIKILEEQIKKEEALSARRVIFLETDKARIITAIEDERSARLSAARTPAEVEQIEKEYNIKRIKAENEFNTYILKAELDREEKKLAIIKAAGGDVIAQEKAIAELRQKIAEQGSKEASNKEQAAYDSKKKEALRRLQDEAFNLVSALGNAQYENQKNAIQDQIDLIEKKKQAEIEAINATTLSEQDKAAKIAIINARAAAQKEQLELKQRQVQERQARFQKALTIVQIITSTAQAVVAALGSIPYTPANIALATITGAIGAAQLAAAAATPIPKYKDGTTNHPGGWAIVGDGGRKEVVQIGSNAYLTPATDTALNLPTGAKVFKDEMSYYETIGKMAAKPASFIDTTNDVMLDRMLKAQARHFGALQTAIMNKREWHIDQAGKVSAKDGSNWTRYINQSIYN